MQHPSIEEETEKLTVQIHSASTSEDDPFRKEVLWDKRIEETCTEWREDCKVRSELHDTKSKQFKKRYVMLAIPAIVIPLILSGLVSITQAYPLVNSTSMAVVSILSGINAFFNNAKKHMQHQEFSAKFFGLHLKINKELSKRKADRIAADVFIEKITIDYANMCAASPEL